MSMRMVIVFIYFFGCVYGFGDCKTIEQSCNLRPLSIGKGKTIEQSCEIKKSPLQDYLKKLREYQENNTSSDNKDNKDDKDDKDVKIRKDSVLAAYRAKLKEIREKN